LVRLGRYNHIPGGHVYRGHLWLYFSGGASAPTIALFRGIAKIFGGIVALRDDKPEEYEEYPRPKETRDAGGFYPADDKYWNTCQRYLYDNTKALALNDLRLADTVAAYKIDDDEEEYGVDWIDSLLSRGKYGAKKKP
jgi:hypothetical protein